MKILNISFPQVRIELLIVAFTVAPVKICKSNKIKYFSRARRYRKMLGGGMRQAGVLAAAAIVALDEVVPKLRIDHKRAQILGKS